MHFCADGTGVYKTRTVRRLSPSMQADAALLKSIRARPWGASGANFRPSLHLARGGGGANLPDTVPEADTSRLPTNLTLTSLRTTCRLRQACADHLRELMRTLLAHNTRPAGDLTQILRRSVSVFLWKRQKLPPEVNQDESELLLLKTLESPHLWYDTEFPRKLELAGMTKR